MRGLMVVGFALSLSIGLGFSRGASSNSVLPEQGLLVTKICRSVLPDAHLVAAKDTNGLTDREIAYIYLQANLFEVDIADLGIANAVDPDVKAHSEMVAKDHRGVVKQFGMLLEKIGVNPLVSEAAAEAKVKHDAAITKLRSKSGAGFDRAFIEHGVKTHTAVISAIKTVILPATKHEAIIEHFKSVLPAFEHHLKATKKNRRQDGN